MGLSSAANEDITINIRVPGAVESAQQVGGVVIPIRKLQDQLTSMGGAAREAGTSLAGAGQNARTAGGQMSEAAGGAERAADGMRHVSGESRALAMAAGSVSRAFRDVSPALSEAVGGLGEVGREVQHLSHLMGPELGIAIGLVVGAVAVWSEVSGAAAEEQKKLAEETQKANDEMERQFLQAEKLVKSTNEKRSGTQVAIDEKIDTLSVHLADLRGRRADAGGEDSDIRLILEDKIREDKEAIAKLKDERDQAEASDKLAAEKTEQERYASMHDIDLNAKAPKGDGSTLAGKAEYNAEQAQLANATSAYEQLKQLDEKHIADVKESERYLTQVDREESQNRIQAKKAALAAEMQDKRDATKQMIAMAEAHSASEKRMEEERKHAVAENTQIGIHAFGAFASAGTGALMQLAEGQKVSGKAVLRQIGETLVAQGTGYELQGTAEAILLNPQGPLLMAVGATEIATGIGMGAASRGGGGGGGGGSGRGTAPGGATYYTGGQDGRQPQFARASPYSPVPMSPYAAPAGGGVHIYQTFQSTFPPRAEDGENIARATGEALRKGSISPDWAQKGH